MAAAVAIAVGRLREGAGRPAQAGVDCWWTSCEGAPLRRRGGAWLVFWWLACEAAPGDHSCLPIMRQEAGLEDDGGSELETGGKWDIMIVGGFPDPGSDLKLRPQHSGQGSYPREYQGQSEAH